MTRLAEIEGHITSMDALLDVVGAMRSLAGMRIQEAQHALPGIRGYADTMAEGIRAALLLVADGDVGEASPAVDGRAARALVLCTAEHGFVGGFNERLVEAAVEAAAPGDRLFVLGSRGAALLGERGREPVWSDAMASRVSGATETVNHLATELYGYLARGELGRVEVMFGRYRAGGQSTEVIRQPLLPVDLGGLTTGEGRRQPPLCNLPPALLLEKLMFEYVFALLTEAVAVSIASENAARFAAMESAHENVTRKLDQLRQSARLARQDEITDEILELVSGTEATRSGDVLSG